MDATKLQKMKEDAAKAPKGPYYVGFDDAEECGPHRDSGLAMVDTGRESDWPIARLCEWHTARHLANCDPETLLELISEVERLEREAQDLKDVIQDMKDNALNDAIERDLCED